jgi:sugar transferase (PEP-CTERM system associated)
MGVKLAVLEGAVLFASISAAIFAWTFPLLLDWIDAAVVLGQALAFASCCIVAFYYNDLYDLRIVRSFGEFVTRLIQGLGVAFILLAGFYTVFPGARVSQAPFLSSLGVMAALLLPIRGLFYLVLRSRPFHERVLILGASDLAGRIVREAEAQPHFRYEIVGMADDELGREFGPTRYPLLGPLARLDKIIEEIRPDRIIVALVERRGRLPVRPLLDARLRGVLVEEGLAAYERLTGKLAIETLTPSFLIFSPVFRKSRFQMGLKRVTSLSVAMVGSMLCAPLMVLAALLIKLESRGPVFFVQERAGVDGNPFRLYKFRTMRDAVTEEDASVWDRDDSSRITRVGHWLRRLRLDELPQFWNVLRGDMDLVGPRPEMASNVRAMGEQIPYYSLRHVVRPGITGWAQTRHGYSVTLEDVTEKMRYDLYYIKHMSIWLDLQILIDTVKIVLFGRGAR